NWEVTPAQGTGAYPLATRDPRPTGTISIVIENGKALATISESVYESPGEPGSSAPADPSYFARLNTIETTSYHYLSLDLTTAQTGTYENIKNSFHQTGTVSGRSRTEHAYDANYKDRKSVV